jgi:small subunit ribosomal protein S20
MAQHQSSKKRIRQDAKKRLRNRFNKKTTRTAIARLRGIEDKTEAENFLPSVVSMIDKLAKKKTWHPNKAANLCLWRGSLTSNQKFAFNEKVHLPTGRMHFFLVWMDELKEVTPFQKVSPRLFHIGGLGAVSFPPFLVLKEIDSCQKR